MSIRPFTVLVCLLVAFSAGCTHNILRGSTPARTPGSSYFEEGIRSYEEGHYRTSARRFRFGLEEGLSRPDRVQAHKYLAFIACISGQQITCREEFGVALELDPGFNLDAAEIGHPIWGPVFKAVKSKQKTAPEK